MKIGDLYRPGTFGLSFEIFPPKTADGDAALWENVERLAAFRPAFVSCTYGAGGSTRDPRPRPAVARGDGARTRRG